MRDLWTMIKYGCTHQWCFIFHRHMWKLWAVTLQYQTRYCRICGQEHITPVALREAEDEHPLTAWPVLTAVRPIWARWYRHHTKR